MTSETRLISPNDIPTIEPSPFGYSGVDTLFTNKVYLVPQGHSTDSAVVDISTGEMSKASHSANLRELDELLKQYLPELIVPTEQGCGTLTNVARLIVSLDDTNYLRLTIMCIPLQNSSTILRTIQKIRENNGGMHWPSEIGGVEVRDAMFHALQRFEESTNERARQLEEERHEFAHVALFQRYRNIRWFVDYYQKNNLQGIGFEPKIVRIFHTLDIVMELNSMLEETNYLNDLRCAASLASLRTPTGKIEDSRFYRTLYRYFNPEDNVISAQIYPQLIVRLIVLFGMKCIRQSDNGDIVIDSDILFKGKIDEVGRPTKDGVVELAQRVFKAEKEFTDKEAEQRKEHIEMIRSKSEAIFKPYLDLTDVSLGAMKSAI